MQKLGHTFTRIDGSMSPQERINAMEKFDTEKCDSQRTPRFILCSLHACGMGINLERANVAFMLDPWVSRSRESFFVVLQIALLTGELLRSARCIYSGTSRQRIRP